MLNVMFDSFDDDNGIVHDEADSENQAKERQCVDRKASVSKLPL